MNKKIKLFISVGEISGDLQAYYLLNNLIRFFNEKNIDYKLSALGGDKIKSLPVEIIDDITTLSTVGFIEQFKFLRKQVKVFYKISEYIIQNNIQYVLCVDNQGFNLKLAKYLKKHNENIKLIYYFPPPVAIWGKWNAKIVGKNFDLVLDPFEDNKPYYEKYVKNYYYTGHPFNDIYQNISYNSTKKTSSDKITIGIFPGSRYHEIKNLTNIFIKSIIYFKKTLNKEIQVYIALSHNKYLDHMLDLKLKLMRKYNITDTKFIKIKFDKSKEIMLESDLLILASGTVTLQALFLKKMAIIAYKVSPLTYLIAKLLVKVKFIGMSNILADHEIYKELINSKVNTKNIIKYGMKYLFDEKFINEKREYINQTLNKISKKNVIKNTSRIILKYIFNIDEN